MRGRFIKTFTSRGGGSIGAGFLCEIKNVDKKFAYVQYAFDIVIPVPLEYIEIEKEEKKKKK